MKHIISALFALVFLLPATAGAVNDCDTANRVAAFEALLKTKPTRDAVEAFMKDKKIYRDKMYSPRKSPKRLVASVSDSNCSPLDYQHTQHIFDITFSKVSLSVTPKT